MRRLNESASWLSDVSDGAASAASAKRSGDEEAQEGGDGDEEEAPRPQPVTEATRRYLAEALNESATWLDCDVSESEPEAPDPPESPGPPPGPAVLRVGHRQGVERSFSY